MPGQFVSVPFGPFDVSDPPMLADPYEADAVALFNAVGDESVTTPALYEIETSEGDEGTT